MPYATKSQLIDYVTKFEFNEFKSDMFDFRESTDNRFTQIDKRLAVIDRKLTDMNETIRRSIGVLHEQFREELKLAVEYFSEIDKRKVDVKDFDKLKTEINKTFGVNV